MSEWVAVAFKIFWCDLFFRACIQSTMHTSTGSTPFPSKIWSTFRPRDFFCCCLWFHRHMDVQQISPLMYEKRKCKVSAAQCVWADAEPLYINSKATAETIKLLFGCIHTKSWGNLRAVFFFFRSVCVLHHNNQKVLLHFSEYSLILMLFLLTLPLALCSQALSCFILVAYFPHYWYEPKLSTLMLLTHFSGAYEAHPFSLVVKNKPITVIIAATKEKTDSTQ